MEPVSLALGIVPLVISGIKGYRSLRSKFKTFCHYSSQVDRTRKLLGIQRDYFLNETELMLRLVVEDQVLVKEMIKDPNHSEWGSPTLRTKLEKQLDRSLEPFTDTIEDITQIIASLEDGLKCFEILSEEHQGDDHLRRKPFKESLKKLRKRVKITFEKETFDAQIANLEKSNDSLRRLRKQIGNLQRAQAPDTQITLKSHCEKKGHLSVEFGAFGVIRRASVALHEALSNTWSNTTIQDLRHSVRLFLDAKAGDEVKMEVAILCYEAHLLGKALFQTGFMRLQVRSKALDSIAWTETGFLTPDSHATESTCEQPRKRQRVRFIEDTEARKDAETSSQDTVAPPASTNVENALSGHFCPELSEKCYSQCASDTCLGHIDNCTFRHWLYPLSPVSDPDNIVVPISQVLAQPIHRSITIITQLRLALSLASAVLKFASTPWLNDLWTIQDLAFLRQQGNEQDLISTLHFSSELSVSNQATLMDVETAPTPNELQEAQYKYGVRNVTLYSLGVALLAIGRWEHIDPGDVEAVRRMAASQGCFLGPKYQMLTEKVLECDFGYGKDLKKPRLQEAVYEGVIVELEGMIAGLDIGG
ncbi:hypothetical protein QBC38DRAFT_487623 [Podospora fimiseda]|uniref:DUF7580 domain-containing protein n=1 Tax=Podospora fimiseda TaxID=252190 RepID=A0AAN7BHG8_9PEZI|nr:hypothetical protein QBC38DRAFT_487623 [Podospora fimiseda]